MSDVNKIALKRYNKDTKKWDEVRIQSSADITITDKEIVVENDMGAYHPGATIPAGTKLSDILTNLTKPTVHPTYTAPTHQVTFDKDTEWSHYVSDGEKYPKGVIYDLYSGKHIAGQLIHTKITSTVIKNDAGDISSHTITVKVNGHELSGDKIGQTNLNSDKSIATKVIEYQSKPNDKITVEVHVDYADGATKNDDHGTADPVGKIVAGSFDKTISNNANITFIAFETDADTNFETAESYRKAFEKIVTEDSDMTFAEDGYSIVSKLSEKPRMIIGFPSKFDLTMLLSSGMNVTKLFSGAKTTATVKSYARFEEISGQEDITLYSGNELDVEYTIYDIKFGQVPEIPMNIEAMITLNE